MHQSEPSPRSAAPSTHEPAAGVSPRLRRSMLMTPGNRLDRMRKAAGYGADCLVLDLEDSVPPASKAQARADVAQALRDLRGCGRELCVRINALASGLAAADLAALPLDLVDSVMVPKVESAGDLRQLDALLAPLERERRIDTVVTLETPRGILRALEIADASRRTSALFFGSGDYTAATGSALSANALLFARSAVVAAAGATGIEAIDAAYFVDVRNAHATHEDAISARELGFAGKVVFHPAQVAVANEVFSPTAAELQRAEHIVRGYREALAQGHGTTLSGGTFVAIDLVAPAEQLLRRAALVRERDAAVRRDATLSHSSPQP